MGRCRMAKENGHYCPDASPAEDLGGNVILIGSSKKPGEWAPTVSAANSQGKLWETLVTKVADTRH